MSRPLGSPGIPQYLYREVHYLEDYQCLTSLENQCLSKCCGHAPFVTSKAQKLGEIVGSCFEAIEEVDESGRVFF